MISTLHSSTIKNDSLKIHHVKINCFTKFGFYKNATDNAVIVNGNIMLLKYRLFSRFDQINLHVISGN